MEKDPNRIEVLKKIEDFERQGLFDQDVESDPPSRMIMPGEVDYTRKKLSSKIKSIVAYNAAKKFLNSLLKNGSLIVEDIIGGDNFKNLKTGAIVTCNHINPFDSFLMHLAYTETKQKKRKLFRVIKEGNYTSFPGFFGMLMRNFYTLPLSSNRKTMEEFLDATKELLAKDHFILVYPEQSMWWNYKKPKPLKKTAYKFAVDNNVPVLPIFITMRDSDKVGPDGFNVQKYTIHIGEPIYRDENKSARENIEEMRNKNFVEWKNIYESFYNKKLTYTTPDEKLPKEVLELLDK